MNKQTVCYCMGVTYEDIKSKIRECSSFSELKRETSLGEACGRCKDHAKVVYEDLKKEY